MCVLPPPPKAKWQHFPETSEIFCWNSEWICPSSANQYEMSLLKSLMNFICRSQGGSLLSSYAFSSSLDYCKDVLGSHGLSRTHLAFGDCRPSHTFAEWVVFMQSKFSLEACWKKCWVRFSQSSSISWQSPEAPGICGSLTQLLLSIALAAAAAVLHLWDGLLHQDLQKEDANKEEKPSFNRVLLLLGGIFSPQWRV